MRILIVGAGICGLATALLLARDGRDVVAAARAARESAPPPIPGPTRPQLLALMS
jgi:2-polyprenyl-6-methoxyphenol hydroxylase-like FAD-dependent oxidoreductase